MGGGHRSRRGLARRLRCWLGPWRRCRILSHGSPAGNQDGGSNPEARRVDAGIPAGDHGQGHTVHRGDGPEAVTLTNRVRRSRRRRGPHGGDWRRNRLAGARLHIRSGRPGRASRLHHGNRGHGRHRRDEGHRAGPRQVRAGCRHHWRRRASAGGEHDLLERRLGDHAAGRRSTSSHRVQRPDGGHCPEQHGRSCSSPASMGIHSVCLLTHQFLMQLFGGHPPNMVRGRCGSGLRQRRPAG